MYIWYELCRECRAKVSKYAKTCPYCGIYHPSYRSFQHRLIRFGMVMILMILLVLVAFFMELMGW